MRENKIISVAMVLNNLGYNGISNVVMNLANNLDSASFQVTILAGLPVEKELVQQCNQNNVTVVELPHRKKNPCRYYWKLNQYMKKNHIDIFHIHGNSSLVLPELLISKIRKIPVRVFHCHNSKCSHPYIHKVLNPFTKRLYTNALACSSLAGEWIFHSFDVITNGFNTERYEYDETTRNIVRKKYELEDKFVIGQVGRYNHQKNQKFTLMLFEEIAKRRDDAVLILVGDGPQKKELEDLKEKSKYSNRILMIKESNHVEQFYNAMDCFIFPSLYEGLGIALIEAQINGLYCIASDVVPRETKIGNNIEYIDLDKSSSIWCDEILKDDIHHSRGSFYSENLDEINKYSITYTVKKLENLYKKWVTNEDWKSNKVDK